ncbi:dockerin type I domain-containing protein [Adhaeretor mobilis]|uniref:PEP-CTERM protein-sorting domain-containing protein n=1 Tax=Adhaeretor mobilis TaxID=1930276 RepID=A0A517N116_9BACT|nr:dockerin type I domain-containing protein [Adhaeretor mobilis]QDT00825.1 hypothetical protein HG15A2_41670 [Adhaeretor mobilis]
MKVLYLALAALIALVDSSGQAPATTINFAVSPSPGSNSDIGEFFGSNVTGDSPGFVTTDGTGATPNIGLTWAPAGSTGSNVWEFHSSGTFGGAGFDVPVAQLDVDASAQSNGQPPADPTIEFTVGSTVALELHSFQIGNATDQSEAPYGWTIDLIRLSDMSVVETRSTGLLSAGNMDTVSFDFIGTLGEDYRLKFDDGGANRVRSAIDNLSFGETGASAAKLKLVVSTTTGKVTLQNTSGQSFAIDSYEITSASSSLDAVAWNSLQDSDYEGNGAPGNGNGWEEAGGVGTHQLIESYLTADSTIADGTSIPLGNAFDFDKAGVQEDLSFSYHIAGNPAFLTTGDVEYISPIIDADFNNDGEVDGIDLLVWQRGFNTPSATTAQGDADGNGEVDAQDLAAWHAAYDASSLAAANSFAVPEPASSSLLVLAITGLASRRVPHRSRRAGNHRQRLPRRDQYEPKAVEA